MSRRVRAARRGPERWPLSKRYHVGAEVGVWYNPNNPTQAVLETEAKRSNYWGVAAGLALLLIGLLWLVEAVAA
ncbi:MAG: hypothetical protein DMD61_09860 [Gemmatimonadetes bacterium]|nr:MAG: hypothetical protein DMD61_09860 [Gemmatimonadota bacterium]